MLLSLSVIGAFSLYVYFALLSLTIKPRTLSHWLLFVSACCAAYWAFFSFFAYNAETVELLRRNFRISVLGMFFYFPINLLFVISVVPRKKIAAFPSFLIILPALFFFVINFFYPVVFSDFVLTDRGWMFVPPAGSILNLCWLVYAFSCLSVGIIFLTLWRKNTSFNRERKQMAVLVGTQLLATLLLTCEYVFNDLLLSIRLSSISPVILSVWILGMVIAVKRYQFLSITPEAVSKEILNSVNEIIILINENEEITYMNQRALSLFGIPYRKIDHTGLHSFIVGPHKKKQLIPRGYTRENNRSIDSDMDRPPTIHLTFSTPLSETTEVSMRVSKIDDKYGDTLGYLLIGNEVQDLDHSIAQLQDRWGLTEREAEIALNSTNGQKNRNIASEFGVSEQTVKNHIESVYKKLGVSNRVELLNIISGR
jgi:DNA-binding CsgD family transcriptional regulator